jgi:hypothetical protein
MFRYTSILMPEYSKELEQLLFFNSGQHAVHSAIVDSIEIFGEPFVENDGEHLRVNVRKLDEVQTLFAFDEDILAGLLVYSRVSIERLVVIHIVVREDYSSCGKFANRLLLIRMSQQLRESARRIKGIETIRVMYGSNRTRDYPVNRDIFRRQETEAAALRGLGELQACADRPRESESVVASYPRSASICSPVNLKPHFS